MNRKTVQVCISDVDLFSMTTILEKVEELLGVKIQVKSSQWLSATSNGSVTGADVANAIVQMAKQDGGTENDDLSWDGHQWIGSILLRESPVEAAEIEITIVIEPESSNRISSEARLTYEELKRSLQMVIGSSKQFISSNLRDCYCNFYSDGGNIDDCQFKKQLEPDTIRIQANGRIVVYFFTDMFPIPGGPQVSLEIPDKLIEIRCDSIGFCFQPDSDNVHE